MSRGFLLVVGVLANGVGDGMESVGVLLVEDDLRKTSVVADATPEDVPDGGQDSLEEPIFPRQVDLRRDHLVSRLVIHVDDELMAGIPAPASEEFCFHCLFLWFGCCGECYG